MSNKIAVVGPIPRDTIITHNGETIKKYGCVSHPTIALAKLMEPAGEVIPIANVHKKDHGAINNLFNAYPNINTEGVSSEADAGTIINLKFIDQNNRIESQESRMKPISAEDVSPFLDADCFVFVPITDFEIDINTLKHIKENSSAKIVFDAHGPTSYVDDQGSRLRCYWNDKEDWLPYIDVLKMNLEESLCCWFDMDYTSDAFYDENNTAHLDEFADFIMNSGVEHLFVTLDSRGCVVYTKTKNGYTKEFVKSVPVNEVIDTTGCGDSFAGGLAYGFAVHNDPIKAAQYANVLGARRTQGKDFSVFKNLKDTEAIIAENYS